MVIYLHEAKTGNIVLINQGQSRQIAHRLAQDHATEIQDQEIRIIEIQDQEIVDDIKETEEKGQGLEYQGKGQDLEDQETGQDLKG